MVNNQTFMIIYGALIMFRFCYFVSAIYEVTRVNFAKLRKPLIEIYNLCASTSLGGRVNFAKLRKPLIEIYNLCASTSLGGCVNFAKLR